MKRQKQRNDRNDEAIAPSPPSSSDEPTSPLGSSFTAVDNSDETMFSTATTADSSNSTTSSSFSSSAIKQHQLKQQHFQLPSFKTNGVNSQWENNKQIADVLSTTSDSRLDYSLKQSMYDPKIHLPYAPQQWTSDYEPATELSDALMERIGVSGKPITVAEYMRNALTHPLYGYYTSETTSATTTAANSKDDDWDDDDDDLIQDTEAAAASTSSKIFGRTGDFITAPEISHVFGHCICLWFITQYNDLLGKPKQVQLVEMGPGRGTLMADILQLALTAKDKSDFGQSITTMNLIETSLELREQQQATITESLTDLSDNIDLEFCLPDEKVASNNETDPQEGPATSESAGDNDDHNSSKQKIRVVWYDDFTSFQHRRNKDVPVLMVLQEFLDALPVHVFQMTKKGWRERLIDVVDAEEVEEAKKKNGDDHEDKDTKPVPRLRQVLAPETTPAVDVLLSNDAYNNHDNFPVDSVVEICPEAIWLAKDMAKVLEESRGVALIIDYGEDGTSDTLRAYSKHKQVPLTSMPGQVDVTADVDFFALRKSLQQQTPSSSTSNDDDDSTSVAKIDPFGPITQGEFLMRMGAGDMVIHKIEQDETTEEQAQKLYDALQFLVMPEHMGQRFKVLALGQKRDGIFAPPGFEEK